MRSTSLPRSKVVVVFEAIVFAMLFIVVALPAYKLVENSLTYKGHLSLQNFVWIFSHSDNLLALAHSLVVVTVSTTFATIIGVLLAWLIARSDVHLKGLFRSAIIIPYLIPPFIGSIAWVYLAGPVGLLNNLLMGLFNASDPIIKLYGSWGVIFVMTLYGYPIPYMVTVGPFSRMNPELEEAGRMSSAGTWRLLKDITIPIMLPSVMGGYLLLYLSLLANFGIPAIIGFPGKYYVLTTIIYRTILNYNMASNLQAAAAQSMLLVLIAVLILLLQRALIRADRQSSYAVITGKTGQAGVIGLGRWRTPVTLFLGLFLFVAAILPIIGILQVAVTKVYGLPFKPSNMSLANFAQVFQIDVIGRAVVNSVFLAVVTAAVVVLLSSVMSYMIVKLRVRGSRLMEMVSSIPYAIPGTIVALAMILLWIKPIPGSAFSLYNTIWIILIAYIGRFLILGVRTISSSIYQIDSSLEEAARMSGAGQVRTFRDVVWPLSRASVFATIFLVITPSLTELTLSALLWSVGNETIGVMVFSLHEEGKVLTTAAFSILVLLAVFLANFATRRLSGGRVEF